MLHDLFIQTISNTIIKEKFDFENKEKLNDIISTTVKDITPEDLIRTGHSHVIS